MTEQKTIQQIEDLLRPYVPLVAQILGKTVNLDRMIPLLELAGNPHKKLKVVHVAGTSGKTSTCYFVSALLQSSGMKVGLSVSPHVNTITERVQIDNKPMPAHEFLTELKEFLELTVDVDEQPSYFELLLAFALWECVRQGVDYAVIETGMGGLLDASNVITRADKVCIITDIDYDHMHVLGDTLELISTQKAGIIHNGNHVFCYQQAPVIMSQIEKRVAKNEATLHTVNEQDSSKELFSSLPLFQARNYYLAHQTVEYISKRDKFVCAPIDPNTVAVPGRMETRLLKDGSTLILDGAHNKQKVKTFVESFKHKYPGEHVVCVLALKEGKEYQGVIDELEQICSEFILTTFNSSQDLPVRSQKPSDLYEYCKRKNIKATTTVNLEDAVNALEQRNSGIKLVIGSFYMLGQIKSLLEA